MRRACIVLWAGLTAYGLFQLLGLTGLSLACVYVTAALRRSRTDQRLLVELPRAADGLESDQTELPVADARPLIGGAAAVLGMSLVCGLSPAQGAGGLGV
ncbi:MAG: hypothetical protein ACJ0RB_05560 [Candidatus Azotimanducaceae bacterium]